METTFTIQQTWLEHSSGSKFHHTILAQRIEVDGPISNVASATALHFAGFGGNFEKFRRPVDGGQVQIKSGNSAKERIAGKIKDGYEMPPGVNPRKQTFHDEESFRTKLRLMFGATKGDEMIAALEMKVSQVIETDSPSPHPETDFYAPIERNDSWGAW